MTFEWALDPLSALRIKRNLRIFGLGLPDILKDITGELPIVQACIERAGERLSLYNVRFEGRGCDVLRNYRFLWSGRPVGSITVSVLPKQRTRLAGYQEHGRSEDQWLLQYVLRYVPPDRRGNLLQRLLNAYSWQKDQGIFELPSESSFELCSELRNRDLGWERFGLADPSSRMQAYEELHQLRPSEPDWQHGLEVWASSLPNWRDEQFAKIIDHIATHIEFEGLAITSLHEEQEMGAAATVEPIANRATEPPKPPEPRAHGGKIDLWLDWYHAMLDNGYKCTLDVVAKKSGYSLGYIKQKHAVRQGKPNQVPNQEPNHF